MFGLWSGNFTHKSATALTIFAKKSLIPLLLLLLSSLFTQRSDSLSTVNAVAKLPDQEMRVMLPMIVGGSSAGPLATDDSYQTAENTPLVADAANGVLANDSAPG